MAKHDEGGPEAPAERAPDVNANSDTYVGFPTDIDAEFSPAARPLFLRPSLPEREIIPEPEPPPEVSREDLAKERPFFYGPSADLAKPLSARQREVARLLWLGKSLTEIARSVGYTVPWVWLLSNNPRVKVEVERLHELAFDRTIAERLKTMGPLAMDVIEQALRGGTDMKAEQVTNLARWAVEMSHGRAGQKVDFHSSTLDKYMEVLSEMQSKGEVLDVTPGALAPARSATESVTEAASASEIGAGAPAATDAEPESWGAWLDANMKP